MTQKIIVIKGDGIGPEIMDATLAVLDALKLDFQYDFKEAGLAALDLVPLMWPCVVILNYSPTSDR